MSRLSSFFLLFIFFLYIIPISISFEGTNNSTENITESLNNTNETFENDFDYNPLKDFDFGNLIWLDDTNATSEIKKHELLFVAFYSPWCQHCQHFLPEYVATSKYAEENNLNVKFAKIDTSVSQNISEEFMIQGIPSIFLIIKGEKYAYEGERNKESILKFLKRKLNGDVYQIETLSQIKNFTDDNPLVLLSTFKDKNNKLHQSFLNYSKTAIYIDFISCQTEECEKEYKQDIILFKKFDEKINKYSVDMPNDKEIEINSVKKFVGIYGVETGATLNTTEINMMFEHQKKMIFYFRNSSIEEQTKFDSVIKELGKEYRSKNIYTVKTDIEGGILQENVASTFIIVPRDLPALLFYDLNPNLSENDYASIYSLRPATKEQLKIENIKEFIDNALNGKIKKDLFSEPPLDNYIIGGLKYVIGRTFDKDVIEEKNNVFLTFIDSRLYSPETDKLLDIMRNLTKKYPTEESKVVFAYSDAVKNQPRDVDINNEAPPLVVLFTNAMSEKKVIKMNQFNLTEITEEDVEDFLSEQLNWERKTRREKKEKVEQKKENKEEKKTEQNKNEEKKETQTDL